LHLIHEIKPDTSALEPGSRAGRVMGPGSRFAQNFGVPG